MSKTKLYWALQLVGWGCYLFFILSAAICFNIVVSHAILVGMINVLICLTGTHLYRKLLKRNNSDDTFSKKHIILFALAGSISIAFVLCSVNAYLFALNLTIVPERMPLTQYLIFQFLDCYRFLIPWFIFYHGIKFTQQKIENVNIRAESDLLLKTSELQNLKNQLNPHFLFNSLNSIKALTLFDPIQAREATDRLSQLLRMSLDCKDLQVISLQEELALVKEYLALEKIRFDRRLLYDFEIDNIPGEINILPMSLHLLTENAIKHGISKLKSGGKVTVFARKERHNIVFGVRNPGLYQVGCNEGLYNGGGLKTLEKRISLNYGVNGLLEIYNLDDFVIAQITLPLQTGQN